MLLESREVTAWKGTNTKLGPAFTCRLSEDKGTDFLCFQVTNQHICRNNHRDHHGNLTSDAYRPSKSIPAIQKDSKGQSSTDSILLAGIVGHITHIQRFSLTFIDLRYPHVLYILRDFRSKHLSSCDVRSVATSRICPHGLRNFRPAYLLDTCVKVLRWKTKGQS